MADLFYENAPDFNSLQSKIKKINDKFDFVDVSVIGRSHLSREIYALKIGNGKKTVLYAAAFHAQEWLTTLLLMRFFEELCESVQLKSLISQTPIFKIFNERSLALIPMVNPDGVEIAINGSTSAKHLRDCVDIIKRRDCRSWQANAVGIDLNHNFDAGFELLKELERKKGIHVPSARQYGGTFAHSEPETAALVNYCTDNNVISAFAFHSQGEEIFYEYGKNTPARSRYIAKILSLSSGYALKENFGLCSHGGFKDWFIDKIERPAFTIEIGKGQNPLPISQLDNIYNKLREMLVVGILC